MVSLLYINTVIYTPLCSLKQKTRIPRDVLEKE